MIDEAQEPESEAIKGKKKSRIQLRVVLLLVALLLLCLFGPPWVSIGRYRGRIAEALSASVGRPVQMSDVEMRLVPWPSFVISNLSIAEDPAYGSEPVLHADTVRADIRLLSLWRGRLEIGSIHVDDASLNIVRAGEGRWNLDPLFRTAATRAGGPASTSTAVRWPSLEATNSRINIKNGVEKLPFSLLNTDLTFWQESPGEWRIRLRGEPMRTDVAVETSDTGTVRIEASMQRAPALSQMPVRLDLEWREAQLGQLTKLLLGSDPGWRGDLTGNLHLEGTGAAAQITARLQATGVHRAEFAPVTPLDFDANCAFLFRYAHRAVENLNCNSPLGNGRVRVTGNMPGGGQAAHLTAELDKIPVAAGLDAMRTMRSGLAPDLEAAGTVSGRIDYASEDATQTPPAKPAKKGSAQRGAIPHGPLQGSLTMDGFSLSGGGLGQPLQVPHVVLEAIELTNDSGTPVQALSGIATLNIGAVAPMNVSAQFTASGYHAAFRGQASIVRARELAKTAGWQQLMALDDLAGDPLVVNLTAAGPWFAEQPIVLPSTTADAGSANVTAAPIQLAPITDSLSGTVTLHNANWKANYLANHVEIAQGTLHLDDGTMRWDGVAFTYGPLKGTAAVTIPMGCTQAPPSCAPQFAVQFKQLDAGELEAALLGAPEKGTLLSNVLDKLRGTSAPAWPAIRGTVTVDSLVMGPVTIDKAAATVEFAADHADLSDLAGSMLGGQVQGSGTIHWPEGGQQQPSYSIEAHCDKLNAAAVGNLLGQRWNGGPLKADGKLEAAGFTDADLAGTARGDLHFDWKRGSIEGGAAARFDEWSGDAQIGKGAVTITENELVAGGHKQRLDGAVTFATPPKVKLVVAKAQH